MFRRLNPFRLPDHVVLSLEVQAKMPKSGRVQGRFEVLVRHLLNRFLNNELMSSDGETMRAIQLGYVIALPGLVVALMLFPVYHAFPPLMGKRTFWLQVSDHYLYVMYSMVVMGIVTVYEWDMLFPDLMDVFVLSVLPIEGRKLFWARVLALVIFFALVLLGTNSLGTIFLPMVADLPSLGVHLFAHAAAVIMGGSFTIGLFLALQGLLLNLLGGRMFRRITPLLQGASITILLTVSFLYPLLSRFLQALLSSGSVFARCFPPFWFLGIYERLLGGPSTLPIFKELARSACWATSVTIGVAIAAYPLAYRRRVRQLIEGSRALNTSSLVTRPINRLLHATILQLPERRAIFHFISQTIMRIQKHRVLLAMYGGLGIAITLAETTSLTIVDNRLRVGVLSYGIYAAVPVLAFWTVAGLRTALAAPIDRRGSWIFRVIIGRAGVEHLNGAKIWVATWGFSVSLVAMVLLCIVAPALWRTPLDIACRMTVAVGLCLLLTDCLFLAAVTIPFTELRKTSIVEMPLVVVRYFVVFPLLVLMVVHSEMWLEVSVWRLIAVALAMTVAHLWLRWRYGLRVQEKRLAYGFEDGDELFQRLGLGD